jgi:pheromone shutdown protein TraB
MKYAVEEAEALKANLVYGGLELDSSTLRALELEKRMDFLPFALRATIGLHNKLWVSEEIDTYNSLRVHGGEAFAESMDRSRLNWFVKLFEKYAPRQKQIIVDLKDEEIFYSLYRTPGKKIVAVVNQWHVPGVETHWRHATGTEVNFI